MKSIKILISLTLIGILSLTSCKDDDNGPQGPGIEFENCDDTACDDQSCALLIPLISDIACSITSGSDVDWYAIEINQETIDNNSGVYSFNFINQSDNMTFKVGLFAEGAESGDVSVTGNGDLEYEPSDDIVGGIQFFQPGTYYISVQSLNGQDGLGTYEIRIN